MRPKERIPIFLELVDLEALLRTIHAFKYDGEIDKVVYRITNNIIDIKKFWEGNPDLRFLQVLMELEYIPKLDDYYSYVEDEDILEKQNVDPLKYMLWTSKYDKNDDPLPEPITRKMVDLDTEHIQNILKYHLVKWVVPNKKAKLFLKILDERRESK